MSDEDKQRYDEWLDLPTTILGENQGRHDATKFKIIRYFWKYSGEWLDYSDDKRFELAWDWHQKHCIPPRPKEEFDSLCKWTIDTFRKERDIKHEEERGRRSNYSGMNGCITYQTNSNPDKFIISTPDCKVIEQSTKFVSNSDKTTEKKQKIVYTSKTFLACKPVRIIQHKNPLAFLNKTNKYTMQFTSIIPSGNFTLKQKTLQQILSYLKETQALTTDGLDAAFNCHETRFRGCRQPRTERRYRLLRFPTYQ